jgi:hypothetical protein
VVGCFSDATAYVNELLVRNGAFSSDFSGLLTQVWDFDDATNQSRGLFNNLNPVITQNVSVIRYFDDSNTDSDPGPNTTEIRLGPQSWSNYPAPDTSTQTQAETPPLPAPLSASPFISDAHHGIVSFMLLHAALNRAFGGGNAGSAPTMPYTVQAIDLAGPVIDTEGGDHPAGTPVSQGTGQIATSEKLLVDPSTVSDHGVLSFLQRDVQIKLMLYQLVDVATGEIANVVPNWFGVAVPNGVTDFTKPIIFFHPTPSQNGYFDAPDYQEKTTTGPKTYSGRDWRELFAYMDRLGAQLAGAVLAGANPNQIIIMPFMTTGAASQPVQNVFNDNWLAIATAILQDVSRS